MSTSNTHTITLSRAHKIAERLGARIAECKSKAEKLAVRVLLQGYAEAQIDRLYDKGHGVIEEIETMERLVQAQVHVRSAIGRANTEHGVSTVLTRIEGNKRMLSVLNSVIDAQDETSSGANLQIDEVSKYKPVSQGSESIRGSYVSVTVMSASQIASLKAQLEGLERKNFELSDILADLNGEKVTIELSYEVSEMMGLSKS